MNLHLFKLYKKRPSLLMMLNTSLMILAITACQSESGDVYTTSKPSFESQITDVTVNETEAKSDNPDLGQSTPLPKIGAVNRPEFDSPQELVSPKNAKLIEIEQTISVRRSVSKPMLDLLFVIDDSNSMDPHQKNLANAMTSFTEELTKLNLLDYRIGVTSIYDSKRYFKTEAEGDDRYEQGVTEFSRLETQTINGHVLPKRNFHRLGRLVPLKGQNTSIRYATPRTDTKVLEDTLKLGAQIFQKYDEYVKQKATVPPTVDSLSEILSKEAKGPRYEEVLAPMLSALSLESLVFGSASDHYRNQFPRTSTYDLDSWVPPTKESSSREEKWMSFASKYNQNFVREKAHLGVIFVTDTVDQSVGLSPEMAADALKRLKGDDGSFAKISTYGVLHKNTVSFDLQKTHSKEWSRRHCTTNNRVDDDVANINGFKAPQKLEAFLRLTAGQRPIGSNILNICSSNYGANLVQIAKDLFKKSVQRGEYDLTMLPSGTVQVYYKNEPTKIVPVCQTGNDNKLCWQLMLRSGVRKLILLSQDDLGTQELTIKYQAIDPTTANQLNSGKIGE